MVGSGPHFCRSSPTDFILMRLKAGFLWTGDGALLVLLHRTSAVLVIRSRAVYLDQSVGMNPFQQLHEQILADILLNTGNLNRKLLHDLLDGSMAVANPASISATATAAGVSARNCGVPPSPLTGLRLA